MFFDVDLTFFDVDLSFFDVDLSFAPAIHRARTVQTPTLNGSFSTSARMKTTMESVVVFILARAESL